jgi:hypothetical protein
MAGVKFHFKDGTIGDIAGAVTYRPYTDGVVIDENFVEAIDPTKTGMAVAPVENLDYATKYT